MRNIAFIIQARLGSTRLPNKILLPFYKDKTILDIVTERIKRVEDTSLIVATSTSANNNKLEEYLISKDITVFRGEENDVLNRFICAAKENGIDGIIRICSDNPFLDYNGLVQIADVARTTDCDYVGFKINNTPSIKTHFGFWGEYVSLSALERVERTTPVGTPAHEHVTIYIYTHPEEYKVGWIDTPAFIQGRNDIRLTVDTKEDFENAQEIYSIVNKSNPDFTLEDVIKCIDSNPKYSEVMRNQINKNSK